ncbi:hypothetical protein [Microbacterium kunmingense]|uniref:hypothetical protein n=1 Tax=Microbacterium kunmingense TaxID=2915939 RepID=UPI003D74778D
MPITRQTSITIVDVDADDHGNVDITVHAGAQTLTPAEARTVAGELTLAATKAEEYRAEQVAMGTVTA